MKKVVSLIFVALLATSLTVGCSKEQTPAPAAKGPAASAPAPAAMPSAAKGKEGKVVETMNSGGYTYVQVDTGAEKIWAAAPEFKVKVGDAVVVPEGMPMANYHSKTLNRDFDVVYFVDSVMVGGVSSAPAAMPAMPAAAPGAAPTMEGHPPVTVEASKPITGVKKADKTVAELFDGKGSLNGKVTSVRGKVVKFSPEIMGKNWIHLQDGTGKAGTNDLTVTTKMMAKVGDTVVVTGPVSVGKDFGYGYKYDVMIEDATVTPEK